MYAHSQFAELLHSLNVVCNKGTKQSNRISNMEQLDIYFLTNRKKYNCLFS